jgi:hypothetical protein
LTFPPSAKRVKKRDIPDRFPMMQFKLRGMKYFFHSSIMNVKVNCVYKHFYESYNSADNRNSLRLCKSSVSSLRIYFDGAQEFSRSCYVIRSPTNHLIASHISFMKHTRRDSFLIQMYDFTQLSFDYHWKQLLRVTKHILHFTI